MGWPRRSPLEDENNWYFSSNNENATLTDCEVKFPGGLLISATKMLPITEESVSLGL